VFNKNYIIILLFSIAVSIPAFQGKIKFTQSTGDIFYGYVMGDEWQNWHETENGFTISKDNKNNWYFVKSYNGELPILTNHPAHLSAPTDIQKHIKPVRDFTVDYQLNKINIENTNRETWLFPLLLIDFPDLPASYSVETFDDLMNENGYSGVQGQTGSFRDYYLEISYGQFDTDTEVLGWFTSAEEHINYGDDTQGSYNSVREMIGDAIDEAEVQGIDWSQFDNDGDGFVDGINIVHAGQGAEEGNGSNIWSHKWSLGSYTRFYDGVWIDAYSINPEKQNAGYSGIPGLTHIGVISHEFGHALGLPDLYDTDYSSSGIGTWGLMSGGSWGGNGSSPWYPSHMCAWAKIELGWIDPIVLDNEISITLDLENVEENPTVIKLNGSVLNSQYFLIENRQQIGSDQTLKNSGLLIWHINDSQYGNSNDDNRLVDLEQADGLFQLNNGYNDGDLSDPYPGTMNITRFANETIPSSQYNNGSTSNIIVTDIIESDEIITATFQNMPSLDIVNINSIELDGDGDGIVNPNESFAVSFQFENPSNISIENLNITLSSISPYITLFEELIEVGSINGNSNSNSVNINGFINLNSPPINIPILIELIGDIEGGTLSQFLVLEIEVSLNQSGFPFQEGGVVKSSPIIIDLDGDGENEIIFGTMNGDMVVLNSDGTFQTGNWPNHIGGQFWASPAVADIDNDGVLEIIITNHNKNIYVFDPFGNIELEYFTNQFLVGTPSIGNLDIENDLEIVFAGIGQTTKLYAINSDTTYVDGFPIELNENVFTSVSLFDFNENNKDDIVLGTDDGNLYLIYDNGEIAESFPIETSNGIKSDPIIANIDGNSSPEILFGNEGGDFYCIKSDGSILFQVDVESPIRTSPGIIEDEYGIKIFFGDVSGYLHGITPVGNSLIGWPKFYDQDILVSPIFSDLNNDGNPEVITSNKIGDYIICDLLGNQLFAEQISTGVITESQPTIADIDLDGDLEIFIGNQNGLSALDIKFPGEITSWNMFKGNSKRNGFLNIENLHQIMGDINFDGFVNILDVLIIVNTVVNDLNLSESEFFISDLNADNIININDIVLIVQIILNDY